MSKYIFITLNNPGTSTGPYNLTLVDGIGNETPWSGNPVTLAQLTPGYSMVVPDSTVDVKIDFSGCATGVTLTIPTTQCPCTTFNFTGTDSEFTTFKFYKCGETSKSSITIGDITESHCVDRIKPITVIGPGSYENTETCCS